MAARPRADGRAPRGRASAAHRVAGRVRSSARASCRRLTPGRPRSVGRAPRRDRAPSDARRCAGRLMRRDRDQLEVEPSRRGRARYRSTSVTSHYLGASTTPGSDGEPGGSRTCVRRRAARACAGHAARSGARWSTVDPGSLPARAAALAEIGPSRRGRTVFGPTSTRWTYLGDVGPPRRRRCTRVRSLPLRRPRAGPFPPAAADLRGAGPTSPGRNRAGPGRCRRVGAAPGRADIAGSEQRRVGPMSPGQASAGRGPAPASRVRVLTSVRTAPTHACSSPGSNDPGAGA